jgi:hypothetical protein
MLKEGMTKAQVVAVLQGYAYDMNRIVVLVPHGAGAAKQAQLRLKELKNAVHSDFKHRHTIAPSTKLTPMQQAKLVRTIQDVFAALQGIGVNTIPNAEWRSALFGAELDLQGYLADLRDPEESVEIGAW